MRSKAERAARPLGDVPGDWGCAPTSIFGKSRPFGFFQNEHLYIQMHCLHSFEKNVCLKEIDVRFIDQQVC